MWQCGNVICGEGDARLLSRGGGNCGDQGEWSHYSAPYRHRHLHQEHWLTFLQCTVQHTSSIIQPHTGTDTASQPRREVCVICATARTTTSGWLFSSVLLYSSNCSWRWSSHEDQCAVISHRQTCPNYPTLYSALVGGVDWQIRTNGIILCCSLTG